VRMKRAALLLPLALLIAREMRAEYVVLRSGQRLTVTSYVLNGDKYQLQMAGGSVNVAAEEVVAIEPEEIFTPLTAKPVAKPPYRELVEAAAARYKVDADLITSVIAVESNFDPKAVSRKKARGLMQLLPETAARLGVRNIEDPKENIDAGTRYLRDLLQKYNNNLVLALAAYNAGPERIERYGRVPPFAETISYVRRVKRGYESNKSDTLKKTAALGERTAPASLPRADHPQ
jgi:soluble lytic murein transglycosylase-like protein